MRKGQSSSECAEGLIRYPEDASKELEIQTFSSGASGQEHCYTDLGIVGTQAVVEAKRKKAYWEHTE